MRINRPIGLLLLSALASSVGCFDVFDHDDWMIPEYELHRCTPDRATAGGNLVCSHDRCSVVAGFVAEAEIERCVDEAHTLFWDTFPELYGVRVPVAIHDHYAFRLPNSSIPPQGASGWHPERANLVYVSLWSRKESSSEPAGVYWKESPPGEVYGYSYSTWRYTDRPLLPALPHQMLHACIGDPTHSDPRWARVPGTAVCDGCVTQ